MNAIRRDEELDNLHSIYVDQWDWEKVIDESTRNEATLKDTVERIVSAICGTLDELKWQFSDLSTELCREVFFIKSQELEDLYPDKTPKERGTAHCERAQDRVHPADRREAEKRQAPRRPGSRLRRLGAKRRPALLARALAVRPGDQLHGASGWTRRAWTGSSPWRAARSAGSCPSTRCSCRASCP